MLLNIPDSEARERLVEENNTTYIVVGISITSRYNHQSGVNPFAMVFSKVDVRGGLAELRAEERISLSKDYASCMAFLLKSGAVVITGQKTG